VPRYRWGGWAAAGGGRITDVPLSIRPAQFVWSEQPALGPGAEHALLLGDPSQPGRYVFRLRVPAGHVAKPHTHPDERTYTVLAGTFCLGFGERFSTDRLEDYPEGSVVIVRGGRHHFQVAKFGGYTVQVQGEGPTAVEYIDPQDDPRRSDGKG
jgi:hypothetical protein